MAYNTSIKFVIIPSSKVTDEMKGYSSIDTVFNFDKSSTVFSYKGNQPSVFESYTIYNGETEFIRYINLDENKESWHGPKPEGIE